MCASLLACVCPFVVLVGVWLVSAGQPPRKPWQGTGKGNALDGTPTCVCVRPSYEPLALHKISEPSLFYLSKCDELSRQGFVYIRVVPFWGGVVRIYKISFCFLLNTC